MRVSKQVQAETRDRILAAAQRLFQSVGFDAATTRDVAREAGIAAGTLFNYFPAKESIAVALVTQALEAASAEFPSKRRPSASLEEELFVFVTAGLRKLRPHRKYIHPVLETSFNPLATLSGDTDADFRSGHLGVVHELLQQRGLADRLTPVAAQLYWTLYTGVLAFWGRDTSPRQEDTLALLDQSLHMFTSWLSGPARAVAES